MRGAILRVIHRDSGHDIGSLGAVTNDREVELLPEDEAKTGRRRA